MALFWWGVGGKPIELVGRFLGGDFHETLHGDDVHA